jgi:hypothetical protein
MIYQNQLGKIRDREVESTLSYLRRHLGSHWFWLCWFRGGFTVSVNV